MKDLFTKLWALYKKTALVSQVSYNRGATQGQSTWKKAGSRYTRPDRKSPGKKAAWRGVKIMEPCRDQREINTQPPTSSSLLSSFLVPH